MVECKHCLLDASLWRGTPIVACDLYESTEPSSRHTTEMQTIPRLVTVTVALLPFVVSFIRDRKRIYLARNSANPQRGSSIAVEHIGWSAFSRFWVRHLLALSGFCDS